MSLPDGMALFVVVVGLLLAIGALRLARRRGGVAGRPVLLPPALISPRPAREPAPPPASLTLARRISGAFQTWLAEHEDHLGLWISFDQLVRELLTEHLGATRVRCYHVRAGCETLQPLRSGPQPQPQISNLKSEISAGPSAREGVLGHVATTGKEFAAHDPAHGPLLDRVNAGSDDQWAWVWPIRQRDAVLGLVAVGNLYRPETLTGELRQTVGPLLSLCWQHVACLERLDVVQRTDRASGVLTRNDFFALAGHALADSYAENEPVVVAVLALEGLRRLDDTGCWRGRDLLIERLGQLIARRVRSDDLVGRFADDRFVILLRRLDSGLGRLIAEKMLATAEECVAQLAPGARCAEISNLKSQISDLLPGQNRDRPGAEQACLREPVRLRIGLAGSGLARPPLENLLVAAFAAVEQARKQDLSIATDLTERNRDAAGGPRTGGDSVGPVSNRSEASVT